MHTEGPGIWKKCAEITALKIYLWRFLKMMEKYKILLRMQMYGLFGYKIDKQ